MLAFWALLLAIGYYDWQHRRISNHLCALLLLSIACNSLIVGQSIPISAVLVNLAIALLLTLPGYCKGVLGGGDVKLMIVLAPAWQPLFLLQAFTIGVLGLALFMTVKTYLGKAYVRTAPTFGVDRERGYSRGLPLGTAMAMGGLLGSALSLLQH